MLVHTSCNGLSRILKFTFWNYKYRLSCKVRAGCRENPFKGLLTKVCYSVCPHKRKKPLCTYLIFIALNAIIFFCWFTILFQSSFFNRFFYAKPITTWTPILNLHKIKQDLPNNSSLFWLILIDEQFCLMLKWSSLLISFPQLFVTPIIVIDGLGVSSC